MSKLPSMKTVSDRDVTELAAEAAELNNHLVAQLERAGRITSAEIAAAFRATPATSSCRTPS